MSWSAIHGRYHPHDCCSWHTRPCTVNYTFSNAVNSANTPMNILSYKNMRLQVAAPQLQLLIITSLAIKLFLAKLGRCGKLGTVRKDCGKTVGTVRGLSFEAVTLQRCCGPGNGAEWCGKTAETLRKHCGHNAEDGRSRCGRDVGVHSWATIFPGSSAPERELKFRHAEDGRSRCGRDIGVHSWATVFPGSSAPERELEFRHAVFISRSGEPGNEATSRGKGVWLPYTPAAPRASPPPLRFLRQCEHLCFGSVRLMNI